MEQRAVPRGTACGAARNSVRCREEQRAMAHTREGDECNGGARGRRSRCGGQRAPARGDVEQRWQRRSETTVGRSNQCCHLRWRRSRPWLQGPTVVLLESSLSNTKPKEMLNSVKRNPCCVKLA
ncbi:DUF2029 domain-containing protein [Sesbania bispinosa]|nr:DUF2029 domain-containing protein [Sesbania bispinosa]